jgi:hypothetical protein
VHVHVHVFENESILKEPEVSPMHEAWRT